MRTSCCCCAALPVLTDAALPSMTSWQQVVQQPEEPLTACASPTCCVGYLDAAVDMHVLQVTSSFSWSITTPRWKVAVWSACKQSEVCRLRP